MTSYLEVLIWGHPLNWWERVLVRLPRPVRRALRRVGLRVRPDRRTPPPAVMYVHPDLLEALKRTWFVPSKKE